MKGRHRVELWESRLTAKLKVCYFCCLVRRAEKGDKWLRFVIALLSSGTVVALLAEAGMPWMQLAAILTAGLSISHVTVLDYPKRLALY